jgi:sirohydrochlorin cobaltochelatase
MSIIAALPMSMCVSADGNAALKNKKSVILVISFGTSFNDSRAKTIGAIEKTIANAYPHYEVRRAFTSQIIINHIEKRDGEKIDNIKAAMQRLKKDGVKELIVQPTHVMSGKDCDEIKKIIAPFEKNFTQVRYGKPLLTNDDDFTNVVKIITDETKQYAANNSAVVFMGHGTEHSSNDAYAKFAAKLKNSGHPNYIVGAIAAEPSLDDVIRSLDKLGVKNVALLPFMIVAGDHANNDMASDKEDSWKKILQKKGYAVTPVLRGLGEYAGIQNIFVQHIADAINNAPMQMPSPC